MPVNNIKRRAGKLTISGNLSLSKRIVRGTNPLSLYASSPAGDWRKKEWDYDRSNTQKRQRISYTIQYKTFNASGTLGKSTKLVTPTSRAL
jgi:hypothetical protein